MSPEPAPSPRSAKELARQRLILRVVIIAFLAMAGLVLTVVPRLPMPARIFIAALDVALAGVIWVVLRQKFGVR